MQSNTVYCDKCKEQFEIDVRTKYIKDDVEEVFFNCPQCHEKYTAYYINDKIKKQQKQLRSIKPNTPLATMYRKQISQEMGRLKDEYKEKV